MIRCVDTGLSIKVDKLLPYAKNARKHGDEDVNAIVESIKTFGFDDPVGVWGEENTIVEGHGRVLAAKKIGMTEVPCIRLDHLNDEERRAYGLAHNKTAELSEWDIGLMGEELDNIFDIDMEQFGFVMDSEDDISAEGDKEETTEEDIPDSHVYLLAVSAFGTNSQCILSTQLEQEDSERLIEKLGEMGDGGGNY